MTLPVAVIGAGFSGTIMALRLLRDLPPDRRVMLCERSPALGRGTAYSTRHPDHLLNVRAANMSAFAEEPDGFARWLQSCAFDDARVHVTDVGVFVSRALYGRYLSSMLQRSLAGTERLQLVTREVVDIEPNADGHALVFEGGARLQVGAVVLAIGNLRSADRRTAVYCPDPWDSCALENLSDALPVLIVGTGLTAIDLAIALQTVGFAGTMLAVSRRGLLPREHRPASPWPRLAFTPAERGSLLALLRRVRAEVARAEGYGVDWRSVIDAIRPDTAALWRGLTPRDRGRFLRHLRPFWDVHRHRLAPPVAALVQLLRAAGTLQVLRGRIVEIVEEGISAHVRIRGRDGSEQTVQVQRVVNATGVESASRCADPLIVQLLARGLVRLDPTGLGLEVTEALQVVDADGRAAADLYAIGPIVRGVFWECTAVPDIRAQVQALAAGIGRRMTQ